MLRLSLAWEHGIHPDTVSFSRSRSDSAAACTRHKVAGQAAWARKEGLLSVPLFRSFGGSCPWAETRCRH